MIENSSDTEPSLLLRRTASLLQSQVRLKTCCTVTASMFLAKFHVQWPELLEILAGTTLAQRGWSQTTHFQHSRRLPYQSETTLVLKGRL